MTDAAQQSSKRERLSLFDAAEMVLEECRMVLPGIQALFGFQLIAIFSSEFGAKLSGGEQRLHLLAIVLVVVAAALIMTPAAYDRQNGTRQVTEPLIELSSRLVLLGMSALAVGVVLDVYLVARVVLGDAGPAALVAAFVAGVFVALWFVLPRVRSNRRTVRHRSERARAAT